MLKKIGFSGLMLGALLLVAGPSRADAKVRVGVTFGSPGYVYPVDPYASSYYDPYYYNNYYPPPSYVSPGYVAPYYNYTYSFGRRDRDHDRHEWREHERREHQEFRENEHHDDRRR